jgi:long-chain acyl-CoA synthetase
MLIESAAKETGLHTMWNVADLVETVAARGERAVVLTMTGDVPMELTGRELADSIRHLARGLRKAGIGDGDPLFIVGPNSVPWAIVRLAATLIGAVPVACDDQASRAEIAAFAADSRSRIVFTSAGHADAVRESVSADCAIYLLDDKAESKRSWRALLADEPLADLPRPAPDAPAMIVYTSGTTGAPKSFVLSHANIAANLEALLAARVIHEDDRILLPLPLHHVFPLLVGLLTTMATGATLVFPAASTGPQIAAALRTAGVTVIGGVPRLYTALLAGIEARVAARSGLARHMFHSLLAVSVAARRRFGWRIGRRLFANLHRQVGPGLRLMVSGGAKLEGPIVWKLEGLGWEVLSGYGLAETASMFTGNLPGRKRIGSEGRPLGPGQIRIAEPDAEGTGEIQLRGPNVFAGYRDNPEANREAFTADGWFRTGDLGTLDAGGFLFVTGRVKEQIVLGGGKKVMPEELERHYATHPYIQELALLEREGKLVALVLPDMAALRAAGLTHPEDAVRVALAEGAQALPAYQRVAGFALAREPLPRTRLGKYQRFLLPKLYDAIQRGELREKPKTLSAEDQAMISASPAREVWDFLTGRYGGKGVSLDSNLALDLGLDSLEWMTVSLEIEARARVRLGDEQLAEAVTVRDLLAGINAAATETDAASLAGVPKAAPDLERWLRPTGPGLTLLGFLLYGLDWLIARLVFRLRVIGAEHIPAQEPFVLVANHVSDLDPPVLAAALSWRRLRRLYWAGDVARLFAHGWQRVLARAIHIFPVEERSPASTLGSAKTVLARGSALGWFPESWRSPTGKLQRFLPGIGLVLAERPVMVIPAYITGAFEAMPRTRHWPRPHPIRVTFGNPIPADIVHALAQEPDGPQRIVTMLHDHVAALERAAEAPISKVPDIV